MTRYLVTGGAGFIGSNLVQELVRRGETVRILDDFSTGRAVNLSALQDRVEIIHGDLCDFATCERAVQDADYVLHQGALPSVPRSVRDPIRTNAVNVTGTLHLLQAARNAGVRRLVFASSSSVYGDTPTLPKIESMCPNPLSPYAITKLTGEQYCQSFWRLYGFETVCLRYFNVFGPHQDPASQYSAVIPRFIHALLQEQPLTIHGDGTQSRDFTYIANVVEANLLACHAPQAAGAVVNIACGARHSLLELAAELGVLLRREPRLVHQPVRAGDVPHSLADIGLARDLLGYQPRISFAEGLAETVAWFQRSN